MNIFERITDALGQAIFRIETNFETFKCRLDPGKKYDIDPEPVAAAIAADLENLKHLKADLAAIPPLATGKAEPNGKVLPFTPEESVQAYRLLEEWSNRSLWGNGKRGPNGHLAICSAQVGDPAKCAVCGTTVRTILFLTLQDLNRDRHALIMKESERQMVLVALAHLAVERPGWDAALSRIAQRIDNEVEGRPEMYQRFKDYHTDGKGLSTRLEPTEGRQ